MSAPSPQPMLLVMRILVVGTPGFVPVPAADAGRAYAKSVGGGQTGLVYRVGR